MIRMERIDQAPYRGDGVGGGSLGDLTDGPRPAVDRIIFPRPGASGDEPSDPPLTRYSTLRVETRHDSLEISRVSCAEAFVHADD
jgi:hypothetical protein